MFEDYPEILNVDEVCEILRCGRNNLYALLTSDNEKINYGLTVMEEYGKFQRKP